MKFISSKTKVWGIVAVFCLLAAIFFILSNYFVGFHGGDRGHYTEEQIAEITQQTGEMTAQEDLRREALELSVIKTGMISDADLDWALHLVQTPGTGSAMYTQLRHSDAMITLRTLHVFAPGQKEKIYDVASPFLTSASVNEKAGAMAAIRAIKDKRAVPAVTALLNDPASIIREQAQKTLNMIIS